MVEELREQVAQLGTRVRDYVQHRAQEVAEQTSEVASQVTETAEDYVRERPMTAVAVAAGTGLLVGLVLMRGRNRHNGYGDWLAREGSRRMGMSRRDISKIADAIQDGFERMRPRGESATDKVANLVSSWIETSGSRASEAATAGSRAARRLADAIGSRLS
jgi:hypothetical protein